MTESLGAWLKGERERQGKSVKDVSDAIKIRPQFIEAMEEDRFDLLPPGVIAKGFVEAYARFLGLDPGKAVALYRQFTARKEPPKRPPLAGKRFLPLLIPLVMAFVLFLGFLVKKTIEEQALNARALPVKEEKSSSPAPRKATPRPHTLLIEAIQLTWIEIKKGDSPPYDITLYPGQRYFLKDRKGFILKIGNAAGIKIRFNGQDLGPLGGPGEVVRLVLPSP